MPPDKQPKFATLALLAPRDVKALLLSPLGMGGSYLKRNTQSWRIEMRIIGFLVAMVLSFAVCTASVSAELETDLAEIKSSVQEHLGISIGALGQLLTASGGYRPKRSLEEDGTLAYIEELQKAGLASVSTMQGLPDGNLPNEEFVHVVLSPKGYSVVNVLMED
jgi:hypothetical protein